jgi:hypothetical protein
MSLIKIDQEKRLAKLDLDARSKRDGLFTDLSSLFERNASETRLGLTPTDSIESLDACAQALRDITKQEGFPTNIDWPPMP